MLCLAQRRLSERKMIESVMASCTEWLRKDLCLRRDDDGSDADPSDDAAAVDALADFLLPDILTTDTASPTAFPNGRALADDVIDTELVLITEALITTDCVDANDNSFSASFPYLAPPN